MIIGSKTETVPCRLCLIPTPMLGTKLCDACYELEHRVERDIAITIKILNKLGYVVAKSAVSKISHFIVKHYSEDERPTIKGNGFDGLTIGENREEAEEFIAFINTLIKPKP